MKLFINLTTEANQKLWPALATSMYDEFQHIIAHHFQSQPEPGPLIRYAAIEALEPISQGMYKLKDTLLTFEFDKTDVENGDIIKTLDLFTADQNVVDIQKQWEKELRERKHIKFEYDGKRHELNLKDEEIENLIESASNDVSALVATLWEEVTADVASLTLRFAKLEKKAELALEQIDTNGEAVLNKDLPVE